MDEQQIAAVMIAVKTGVAEVLNGHPDHYGVPNHTVPRGVRESLVESVVILIEDALSQGQGRSD